MSVATGDQVGPYRLEELIGKGAFGVVFRARAEENADVPRGSVVALKVLHDVHKDDARIVQRFHKEARLAVKLSHPHVVRVFGEGVAKGEHYIVMELAEGQSLTEYLRQAGIAPPETKTSRRAKAGQDTVGQADRGTPEGAEDTVGQAGRGAGDAAPPILNLPIPEAVEILRQVASVLQAADDIGLVHRDIKPDNVLVSRDKAGRLQTKVLDFGLAKDLLSHSMSFTSIGKGIGTPPFMAPEQFEGTTTDIRSDLYSLGATAYQMLTGRPPFPGPSLSAYMKQHQEDIPAAACKLNANVPENLSQVVERLLAKKASDRHQKAAELVEDLNRVERGEVPLKRYRPRKARKHSLAFTIGAVAAGILIALALGAAYLHYRSSNAEGRIAEAVSQARYLAQQGKHDESLAMLDATIERWQPTHAGFLTDAQAARDEARKAKLDRDEQARKAKLAQEERERKAKEAEIAARADKAKKHEAEGDTLQKAGNYAQAIAQFEAALAYAPSDILKQKTATATRLKREADEEEARKIADAKAKAEQEEARKRDEEKRVQDYRAAFRSAEKRLGDEDRLDEALKSIESALDLARAPEEKAPAVLLKAKIDEARKNRREWAAVVDFSIDKSVRDATLTGSAIAVKLEQAISTRHRLVDRKEIAKALRELDLGVTDLADRDKAQRFGKAVSAQYLITGSAVQIGPTITIAAKIFSVELLTIRQTAEVEVKDIGEFNALFPELAHILAMTNEEKQRYLDEQRNYPKWVAEGKDLVQQGKWPEAVKAFENAQRAKSTPEVAAFLVEAKKKAEELRILAERKAQADAAVAEGQRLLGERRWAEGEAAFRKALGVQGFEEDGRAKEGLRTAQLEAAVAEGQHLLDQKQWEGAEAAFRKALTSLGTSEDSRVRDGLRVSQTEGESIRRKAEYDRALAAARAALARNDYDTASREAQAALKQDTTGIEAKGIIAKLVPSLTIAAEVGGAERTGARVVLNGIAQQQTTPVTIAVEAGRTYQIEVTVPNLGNKYYTKASKTMTVDWHGPKTYRASITENIRPELRVYKEWPFDAAEARRRQRETAEALGVKVEQAFEIAPGVSVDMVLIPAGEFVIGSPANERKRSSDEDQKRVAIAAPFWMGKHEITEEQWQAVMGRPSPTRSTANFFPHPAGEPATGVGWKDVSEFLRKASVRGTACRLPTEAQWEYACRAGTTTRFCSGDGDEELGRYAWFDGKGGAPTDDAPLAGLLANPRQLQLHPVGGKQPNSWGLYDMHGNAREWCASPYAKRYDGSEEKGSEVEANRRTIRGGSYYLEPWRCRSAFRGYVDWTAGYAYDGLRVIVSAKVQD